MAALVPVVLTAVIIVVVFVVTNGSVRSIKLVVVVDTVVSLTSGQKYLFFEP